jgi:hypothetical protein
MRNPFNCALGTLLCISVALFFVACAKDEVAPVDVEKQAFEDLRTEIREAITDSAPFSQPGLDNTPKAVLLTYYGA